MRYTNPPTDEETGRAKEFVSTLKRAQQSRSLGTAIKYSAITTGVALALYLALQRWRLRNG